MRFVLTSPTKVVDLEKIAVADFTRANPALSGLAADSQLTVSYGEVNHFFYGAEARVLWDQITIESQVSEPSEMFEAVQEVVRAFKAIHPTDRFAAWGCVELFDAIRTLKQTFKL